MSADIGPVISRVRWLPDSRTLAFLVKIENGRNQLWLAQPQHRKANAVTAPDQDVTGFDIRDATHFAYSVRSPGDDAEMLKPGKVSAFAATGLSLYSPLMVSVDDPKFYAWWDRSELWAARGGKPFLLRNAATGHPIILFKSGQSTMALAPDGNSVAISLPLDDVPKEWEVRYPPSPGRENFRLKAGQQDLGVAMGGSFYVSVYVTVDLHNGNTSVLTEAPTASTAGWIARGRMAWSDDGRALLLPGTFLSGQDNVTPCLAVAAPSAKKALCLEPVTDYRKELVSKVQFVPGRSDRIVVDYLVIDSSKTKTTKRTKVFTRTPQGTWESEEQAGGSTPGAPQMEVLVKQSLNDSPVLVVIDHSTQKSRVVWEPNPQLKRINLGEASVYRWKEQSGKQWTGGLYKPADYIAGRRYPLVIQTHGFVETQFRPSGIYPSGFAARALAAAGIVVLQVPDCSNSYSGTVDEAPCHLRGYEAAAQQLVAEGMIDPDRIGMIGFSRTCLYVMQALTASNLHLKAATITDGVNAGYFQYLLTVDAAEGGYQRDADSIIGASPYGSGLPKWIERSPEFNLDKVNAPLQVVASRGLSVLYMWEPYAMLRVLKKPVELTVLNSNQHVLTNPGVRLASQGGTVDWFRFWLKDEEDPDPAKAEQYKRWHELRKLQEENEKKRSGEKKEGSKE